MRAYLLDELAPAELERVKMFLEKNARRSELGEIFWVPVPKDLLNEIQVQHTACHPHVFAVELGKDWVKMELFVRSLKGLRCECQGYATSEQTRFILDFAHTMIRDLEIRT